MKPTDKQIKKFWEWCGFRWDGYRDSYSFTAPDGQPFAMFTLRNFGDLEMLGILFKYAVPKLHSMSYHLELLMTVDNEGEGINWACHLHCCESTGNKSIGYIDKDPVLALFWAIWKVIKI